MGNEAVEREVVRCRVLVVATGAFCGERAVGYSFKKTPMCAKHASEAGYAYFLPDDSPGPAEPEAVCGCCTLGRTDFKLIPCGKPAVAWRKNHGYCERCAKLFRVEVADQ